MLHSVRDHGVITLLATSMAASAACGAGTMGRRCGFADACGDGLTCVHGGPENLGTCERRCDGDDDCGEGLRCELEPPPDALSHVCVPEGT